MNEFLFDEKATYRITDVESPVKYEYNYYNSEILLSVNKFGVNSIQYLPPSDVMLLNTNTVNDLSNWSFWVSESDKPFVNNFAFPKITDYKSCEIIYRPSFAEYEYVYDNFTVKTVLLVCKDAPSVIMSMTVKNTSDRPLDFTVVSSLLPYINPAAIALWDKPEWYVKTCVREKGGFIDFYSKLFNPLGDKTKRRLMTFSASTRNLAGVETDYLKFAKNEDFFHANISKSDFSIDAANLSEDFDDNVYIEGVQSVYALKYAINLKAGEERTFNQILTMQNKDLCGEMDYDILKSSHKYIADTEICNEIKFLNGFYDDMFGIRSIKTPDKKFDYYVNTFLPLQLFWVCGLDRGWPTGMQGTRDSANDFLAMLYYYPEKARKQLLHLFSCMRSDGWMPRQISTFGKNGKHDLRTYSDSTASVLEFLYEYISVSGDYGILKEKTTYLDDDDKNSVLEHYFKGFDYYLDKNNIGVHGLCKLYAGDWLDPINLAGLQGKGESVMVSCQVYQNFNNAVKLLRFLDKDKYEDKISVYISAANKLKNNVNKFAYNKKGYYNGMFTDGDFWIFSDNDPDGKERMYASSNYHAISCGVADEKQINSVLENSERLKCDFGYKLFSPAFDKSINFVGRVASGDMAIGLWENGAVYNQGGNCYRARALAKANKPNELFETVQYIFPYDEVKHKPEETLASPYAITNCYHALKYASGRAGRIFITGSVAMAVRIIYCDMFGIKFEPEKMIIKPCLTEGFSGSNVRFTLNGQKFDVKYVHGNGRSLFNGKELSVTNDCLCVPIKDFKEQNDLTIYF